MGDSVVGAQLLANEKKHIDMNTTLFTPYFSPTLTFIPFWESGVGGRGRCKVGIDRGGCVLVYGV